MGTQGVGTLAVVLGLVLVGATGMAVAGTTADAEFATNLVDGGDKLGEAGENNTVDGTVPGPEFGVTILETTAPVEGDPVLLTVEVENTGSSAGEASVVADAGALGEATGSAVLAPGESGTVALSIGTTAGDADTAGDRAGSPYPVTVTTADSVDTTVVPVGLPAVDTADAPPADLTGDQLYEDIDGDGTFDIFDVQTLFNSFEGPAVQGHTWAFDFNGDGLATIFDVQSLFNRLPDGELVEQMPFEVTVTDIDGAVTEGETVAVDYEVTNTGEAEDTQDITFDIAGVRGGTESDVTLAGGETFDGEFTYTTETADLPGIAATVSSQTDSVTETVVVDEPAAFAVTITDINNSVLAGETIAVDYEVGNTGDVTATQTLTFAVDGATEATESGVTLAGGETFDGTFSYDTVTDDTPGVDVAVASANDSATESVAVDTPAFFDVDITDVDDAVTAGEQLTAEYTVENTGDIEATKNITFAVNGTVEEAETNVTLGDGETFDGQFSYDTVAGDAPAVTLTIASVDDTATETVPVEVPASFDVAITGVDDEVAPGETVTVAYEVTNAGGEGTQSVEFAVNGTTEDTEANVTLGGGETFTGTFSYQAAMADAPALVVTVASENDTVSETVAVSASTFFEPAITSLADAVTAGETLTVAYTVENTGDIEATKNITLAVDGTVERTEANVTLGGGETVNGTFEYETAVGNAPAVTVTVGSPDDSVTESVTVLEPAVFDVALTDIDGAVPAGEPLTVAYEVTNTGDAQATQDITVAVDSTIQQTKANVTLGGGETFNGSFGYQTEAGDVPAVTVTVASENDSTTGTVTVLEPAAFDVTITSVDDAVVAGESLTVAYEVTNTGEAQGTQDITFAVNGTSEGTESGVTLNGSETFTGQFSYETVNGDTPAVAVAVTSGNDTATETVVVDEPAAFDVTITNIDDAVTEGETVTVAYEVTNTGDAQATQDIDFAVNGTTEDTESGVTLNGSETFSGQFSYGTDAGDVPAVSATVASVDDAAAETVVVTEPAFFDATITSVADAVTAGETLTVVYEISNTGDEQDTQNVTFDVDGSTEKMEANVTLNKSETFTGQFSYETANGDTPQIAATVSSADDSASATVSVNEPASFDVTITGIGTAATEGDLSTDVTAGESLTVGYEVTNTGDVTDTQDIEFAVNGTTENTASGVTLNGSETFSGQFTYVTTAGDPPAVSVAVSSDDDSVTETVSVDEPAAFDVTITSVDAVATEGETLTVAYEISNTGDVMDTQDITFAVNGTTEDTESGVTLNGSETFSGQFTYGTVAGDAPAVSVTVSSDDDLATETVSVDEPAAFGVTITNVDAAVVTGETVTVDYEVTNTGDVTDTQTITFAVDGTTEDTETGVTLNGTETFGGQFSYGTGAGDSPEITVTVASADDAATETVSVNEAAIFTVTITGVDTPVTAGETVTVDYEVTNTGDVADTQNITFEVDGASEDTVSEVTLNGSETFGGQFSYDTGAGDAPSISVSVASEDGVATETVVVNEPASFAVTITGADSSVLEGETLTVAYEVTNTGDVQATQDIDFAVDGTTEDTETGVTLNGSETFSGQFSYDTVAGDTPAVSATVSSDDDSASATVVVNEPALFDVTVTSIESAVTEGETITVAYEVTNAGDVQATQDITFAVNETTEDTETGVTLNGSETFSGQFSYDTVAGDAPAVSATVSSDDDSASAMVTVKKPASFEVAITSIDSAVMEGETVTVAYEVTNTGDVTDTQEIGFAVNGTTEDTASGVTLNGSKTFGGQFTYTTAVGDAPAVTVAVSTDDDSASDTVAVNQPPNFVVAIVETMTPVEGEQLNVTATVENTGDTEDTQTIDLNAGGLGTDSTTVTLGGGNSTNVTLGVPTGAGDAGEYTATVSSADDSATADVIVLSPSAFTVDIVETTTPVEGEQLNVTAAVENTGDTEGTQTIDLDVGALGTDSTTVTLGGGDATNLTLSVGTGSGDAGSYTAAVSSNDDSDNTSVTVTEPASFDVTITSADSAVTEGETVTVAYEVTNTGNVTDTQEIKFAVNGTTKGTNSGVTLNGSGAFSGQFTYATTAGDAPAVSVTVSSDDDSANATVTVTEPASFDVTLTSADSAVTEGETVTVGYEVTNTGDVTDTQDIGFAVNGTTEDTEPSVTLNGSETFSGQFTYATTAGDAPAVSVTVSSDDDSASKTITVKEPASFDVTLTSIDSAVTEGETVTVAYEVTNTGDVQATQDITFAVNGTTERTESGVTLNGSETFSGQFTYDTMAGDVPAVSVTVSSNDDSASDTVAVNQPPNFVVAIVETTTPVEGERLNVTAQVENTGDIEDTQTIDLSAGMLGSDSTTVTLGGGSSTNVTLGVSTGAGDAGEYTATVSSTDDSATANVTVLSPSAFTVDIVETTTPIEGERLNVTATIENAGDIEDTQTIDLNAGGLGTDSTTVTLGGGSSTNVTLGVSTSTGDAGEYTATVSSDDAQDTANLTVLSPSAFTVDIVETTTPIEGEQLNLTATVENTGDTEDTQTIDLSVGALGTDSTTVTLGGGGSTNVTLGVSTGAGDAGKYTATVSSADDSATANVTVLAPAEFTVDIVETTTPVEGEQLNVTTTIENTGDAEDTQTIDLSVGALGTDSTTVTLGGGGSTNVTLGVSTGAGDSGEYTATVSSAENSATANVTVLAPAEFSVDIVETTTPLEGEQLNVTTTIENTGDTEDTQTVDLSVDALGSDSTTVTLGGGNAANLTLSVGTGSGDAGSYTAAVSSNDDSDNTSVTVTEPASFDVTITSVESAVTEGETVMVAYEVTNTGDAQETQDIGFAVNGTTEDTESGVTLNGSETSSGQFTYDTVTGDAPAVSVTVSSNDDSANATVTVKEPASFDVTITSIESAVTEGETITVAYEVTNTGDVQETQDIGFAVNRTTEDTEPSVTLNGSETFSGQFTYDTVAGDAPAVSVTVSSDDDSAGATVTVNEPASFDVTLTSIDSAVTEGETVTVAYEVTNTGDAQGTQDITFAVNGTTEGTEMGVTLNGSETSSGQFSYDTVAGDAPAVSVTVSSADDSAGATVTVNEPASFDVTITSVDSAVTAGETIAVDYAVQNTGDVADTQEIGFAVNGSTESTETGVTLNGSETFSGQFTYVTGDGDAPAVGAAVTTDDDSASDTVTVNRPPKFVVTIAETNAPVEGEQLNVTASIENTGDIQDTQTVTLDAGALGTNSTSVSLDGGNSTTETLSVGTGSGDAGSYTATVSSDNDTDSTGVTVKKPANFTVAIIGANTPVVEGETLTVNAEIENTGDASDIQTVTLDVGVLGTNSTSVSLGGGNAMTETLSVSAGSNDAGSYTAEVSSNDDSDSTNVTVEQPANFAVTITGTNAPVVEGETLTVDAEIENTGDISDTQTVTLGASALGTNSTSVSLDGGNSTTETLSVGTGSGDAGSYTAAVSSDNDSDATNVTVTEPSSFDVTVTSVNTSVTEGETVAVAYEVTNTGGVSDTQNITFAVNGTTEDTESGVTLNESETFSGQFTYQTQTGDSPEIVVAVASEDGSADRTVTVNAPALFAVTLTDVQRAVVEETELNVNYTVENTGGIPKTQDLTFAVNGTTKATEPGVTLNGSETFSGQFTYQTQMGDSPQVTVEVASDEKRDSAAVVVTAAPFDLVADLTEVAGAVGDNVSVDMKVFSRESPGDEFGAYQIGISYNDSVISFNNLTDGVWSPGTQDAGNGTISFASFAANGQTPADPALTLNFEIIAEGTSDVAFDNEALTPDNAILNGNFAEYETVFRNGAAGTDVDRYPTLRTALEGTDATLTY